MMTMMMVVVAFPCVEGAGRDPELFVCFDFLSAGKKAAGTQCQICLNTVPLTANRDGPA